MDRRETYIFTHYSDIADAKRRDVRILQAEAARGIMQEARKVLLRAVQRMGHNTGIRQGNAS